MNSTKTEPQTGNGQAVNRHFHGGFTLVELLVVAATVALLLMLVTPAFSRMKPNGYAVQCMNNTKQLVMAWQNYTDDNGGRIVYNLHGGAAQNGAGYTLPGNILACGWVEGWLDWGPSSDNTNTQFLTADPRAGTAQGALLGQYVGRNKNVFKCPADKYLSPAQQAVGWSQRVRSYSANVYIGAGNLTQGPTDPLYEQIIRISDMLNPTPAQTWVYLDEHPDSMNDPAFFSPHQTWWIENPATYHNGAAGFSFADGHSEMHKWTGSLSRLAGVNFNFSTISAPPGDPDVHWVSFHSQRVSISSY